MKLVQCSCVAIGLFIALALAVREAHAQAAPQPVAHTLEGTLETMRPGAMQVMTESEPWLVSIDPKSTTVSVTGTAEVDYLRPGLFVRFDVELDNRGRPTAPINQITIFTPREPTDLGVASASGGFAPEPEQGKKKAPQPQTGQFIVGGKVTGYKNGKLTVAAGQVIKADIADGATVEVDVADYSVASKGDKVTAEGSYVQKGRLVANEVTIALQAPLKAMTKKGRAAKPKAPRKTANAPTEATDTIEGFGGNGFATPKDEEN